MSVEGDVIAAIAADLDANGTLASHTTVQPRRPRAIMPEDCPLMCVWLIAEVPRNQTTERFDSTISVGISWHEETVAEAQTLVNDAAKSTALLDALSKIKARIRHLSKNGLGVGTAWEVMPGESRFLPPEMQQGLTEGYAHEATVQISEV